MKRFIITLALTAAPLALAQDVDINLDAPGMPPVQMQMRVRGPAQEAPAPVPMAPPVRVVGQDTFQIDYGPMLGEPTQITVKSPEGAPAQVWNEDGSLAGTWSVPFNFRGRPATYYRFILWAPNGSGEVIYDRKLETKNFIGGVLRLRRDGPRVQQPPQPMQPPPMQVQVQMAPQCMPGIDFDALINAIENESFSSEKLAVLESAATNAWFTVDQVGRLVDAYDHSSDKVQAVRLTRTHLVDRQNGFKLFEHFTFSSDKDAVKALLK